MDCEASAPRTARSSQRALRAAAKNTSAGASTPPDVKGPATCSLWPTIGTRESTHCSHANEERTRVAWAAVLAKTGHASGELLPLRTAFEVLSLLRSAARSSLGTL